jgi:hypothetical protein
MFRELVITACWVIWTTRNDVIFDNKSFNLDMWKVSFKAELDLVCIKSKQKTGDAILRWCENFL